jgi:DNA-binding NarL/FixJ family response regulator
VLSLFCKIGIIEQYVLFSSSLKAYLETSNEYDIIGIGSDVEELEKNFNGTKPDIILIDILHCQSRGMKMMQKTKKLFPDVPLLLITGHDYSECFTEYLKCGAKGFVFTDSTPDNLIKAIQAICDGKEYFREDISKYRLVGDVTQISKRRRKKEKPLSEREIEIAKLFCDGLTYREIGKKLFISHRTVETHKNNILKKLKLKTKAEMIKYTTLNYLTTR